MATCQLPNLNTTTPKAVILDALNCESLYSKHISNLSLIIKNNINEAILKISVEDFNAALAESRSWFVSTTLRADIIEQFKVDHPNDATNVIDNSFTTSLLGRGGKKSRKYRKKISTMSRRRNKSNTKRKSSRVKRR